jgi:hypothetical protein
MKVNGVKGVFKGGKMRSIYNASYRAFNIKMIRTAKIAFSQCAALPGIHCSDQRSVVHRNPLSQWISDFAGMTEKNAQ